MLCRPASATPIARSATSRSARASRRHRSPGANWDGIPQPLPRLIPSARPCFGSITRTSRTWAISHRLEMTVSSESARSTFSWGELPARTSASPDKELAWMATVASSALSLDGLLTAYGPSGWYGRTSRVSCRPATGSTLHSYLADLPEQYQRFLQGDGVVAGSCGDHATALRGGFLTLNSLEWPSDAVVSSLSAILDQTGEHLQRYCLSPTACRGILRRAERRGKALPPALRMALEAVAGSAPESPVLDLEREDAEAEEAEQALGMDAAA